MFMLDPIKMTKNQDLGVMYGRMDAYMKEISHKMLSNYIFIFRHGKGKLIYTDGK